MVDCVKPVNTGKPHVICGLLLDLGLLEALPVVLLEAQARSENQGLSFVASFWGISGALSRSITITESPKVYR